MTTNKQPSAEYQFGSPVDVLTILDTLGIEHLEVSDERTIIIYDRTIVNVEVVNGRLHDAQTVVVDVFDLGPHGDAGGDPVALIESLIEEIATTAEVDWNHL